MKQKSAFTHHLGLSYSLVPVGCAVLNRAWPQHLHAAPPFVSCLPQSDTSSSFSISAPKVCSTLFLVNYSQHVFSFSLNFVFNYSSLHRLRKYDPLTSQSPFCSFNPSISSFKTLLRLFKMLSLESRWIRCSQMSYIAKDKCTWETKFT